MGPSMGSCSTLIGVIDRSSGTAITTPTQPISYIYLNKLQCIKRVKIKKVAAHENYKREESPLFGLQEEEEKTPNPLFEPHGRIVQPRSSAPFA